MKYDFIQEYCLSKKGAVEIYKQEWDAILYLVGGKIFVLMGNDRDGVPIISMKLDPEYGIELREQYEEVVPGYHLNKKHWNSVYLNGDMPEEILKKMMDQSYELVFRSLSRKAQEEILTGSLI
jgi:predicted DNA-binding protein (MmcQ/YjbR family)